MADCENLNGCPFFMGKMADDKGVGAMFKKKYCQGSNENCARHMVYRTVGGKYVPDNLFPNMVDDALKIIKGSGK